MNESRFPVLPALDGPVPTTDGLHRVHVQHGSGAWLKRRTDRPAAFLLAEADGLERLRVGGGLRTPCVLGLDAHSLLLEDLGHARRCTDFAELAGRGLARQHRQRHECFGLERSGWCGESFQDNTPDSDGHRFFAQRRLLPQARRALEGGRIEPADMDGIERLCARLHDLVPAQPAVLLHGDLWTGNLHCAGDGRPALIDAAAVHYGWAEADLSMLVLFGDPGPGLFEAYAENVPLDRNWRERVPLYNLYHLLNHLNLYGSAYLGAVRSVLRRFVARS